MRSLKFFLLLLFFLASPMMAQEVKAIFIPFYDYIEKASLKGHSYGVFSVVFSPDGGVLASGSADQTIKLWDVKSGALLKTLKGHSGWVLSVVFSPDGGVLASGSADQTIKFWDVRSGKLLRTRPSDYLFSFTFSPDGEVLASGSLDGIIKFWDVRSGALLKTLKGHSGWVLSVAFSPDGGILASGSADQTIKLWDVKSGALLKTLKGHSDSVRSVTFSPDGGVLASGSADQTIKLWDVKSGALLKTLKGHSGGVNSLAFSPDGKVLASGSADQTIRLWEDRLPLGIYEIRDRIWELKVEIDQLEKERESKIAQLYKPKGEFETTKEYEERIARARVLEKTIREEYAQKIRELEDKKKRMVEEAKLKLVPYETSVVLRNYDADRGGFYAEVEGHLVFIPVERSIALVIAQHRDKSPENLIVKGNLVFFNTEKCELVDAFLTVKGTDIAVPFGIRTDTKQKQK